MNARALIAVSLLSLVLPAVAAGQGTGTRLSVQGSVGTHFNDGGDNQSISVGVSPTAHLDILISAERSHWPTEVGPTSATRGGTVTFISGEIRLLPVTIGRVSPYVLASAGGGLSRPNVNTLFRDDVTNGSWLLFGGGGVRVAATERLGAFADMRFGIQGELDTIRLLLPVRGGVAWRF
jgi:hypothetical protein